MICSTLLNCQFEICQIYVNETRRILIYCIVANEKNELGALIHLGIILSSLKNLRSGARAEKRLICRVKNERHICLAHLASQPIDSRSHPFHTSRTISHPELRNERLCARALGIYIRRAPSHRLRLIINALVINDLLNTTSWEIACVFLRARRPRVEKAIGHRATVPSNQITADDRISHCRARRDP